MNSKLMILLVASMFLFSCQKELRTSIVQAKNSYGLEQKHNEAIRNLRAIKNGEKITISFDFDKRAVKCYAASYSIIMAALDKRKIPLDICWSDTGFSANSDIARIHTQNNPKRKTLELKDKGNALEFYTTKFNAKEIEEVKIMFAAYVCD